MINTPLFSVSNVSFSYMVQSQKALKDLSIDLWPGKFYGIVGPNGSGKTTFLDLLTGSKQPQAGTVSFKGKDLSSYPKRHISQEIALVPQEFDTGFGFTVEEIVMMGRHPHIPRFGRPTVQDWQYVDESMEQIGIRHLSDRYTNTLSGGQKQRAVVARAIAQNTNVILFDEATSSLDIKYTLQIFNLAKEMVQSNNHTVIAVIHNLNLATAYCDHLVFFKNGSIVTQGETRKTMTSETIDKVFGVKAKVFLDSYNKTHQVSFQYR